MNFLRKITIALASLLCVIAISGFVFTLTLHTTLMDRTVVKNWLQESKIYDDNKLISALVQGTENSGEQGEQATDPGQQSQIVIPQDAVKTALGNTFTASFIKTQTETVVDSAYDWIDGKTSEFQFSIPIDQKRDTFIQQLAKAIEPQIAALPTCTFVSETGCRPPSLTPLQTAEQLATKNIEESGAFTKPLTNESQSQTDPRAAKEADKSPLTQLPVARTAIDILLIALPIIAVLSIALVAVLSRTVHPFKIFSKLSRRIFFSVIFSFVGSIVVLWIARDNDFGLKETLAGQAGSLGELVAPFVKLLIVGVTSKLALFSGIACLVSATGWIVFSILRRKSEQAELIRATSYLPPAQPQVIVPPVSSQD